MGTKKAKVFSKVIPFIPLLQRRGGGIGFEGASPFKLPLVDDLKNKHPTNKY